VLSSAIRHKSKVRREYFLRTRAGRKASFPFRERRYFNGAFWNCEPAFSRQAVSKRGSFGDIVGRDECTKSTLDPRFGNLRSDRANSHALALPDGRSLSRSGSPTELPGTTCITWFLGYRKRGSSARTE